MSTLTEFIYQEYKQRILSGKSVPETTNEIKQLLEDDADRMAQLWDENAKWLLSNIFARGARAERNMLMQRVPATASTTVNEGVFGERRVNVAVLQRPESVFDSLMHVGNKWVRYGDMRREDWRFKANEYYVAADRSMERAFAAEQISERIELNKTTEQSLSEGDFLSLLPPDGF